VTRQDAILEAVYVALESWDEAERRARVLRAITKADVRRVDRLADGTRIPAPRRGALARHLTAAVLTALRQEADEETDGDREARLVAEGDRIADAWYEEHA
jgi:hypothetical protein